MELPTPCNISIRIWQWLLILVSISTDNKIKNIIMCSMLYDSSSSWIIYKIGGHCVWSEDDETKKRVEFAQNGFVEKSNLLKSF